MSIRGKLLPFPAAPSLFFAVLLVSLPIISVAQPTLTEYPVPFAYYLDGIVPGSDGALWFTASVSNVIGRITTAGVAVEYPIPTVYSVPQGITPGRSEERRVGKE